MSEVTIKVLGDTKNFDSSIDKSTSKTQKMGEKMGKVGKGMTKGLTLPLLGAGAAILALGVKAGQNADRLLDMAAQTGISTDKLQEYEFVAGQAGVSTDFFKRATEAVIKDLDKVVEGIGPAADAYAELGVSVVDANGEMRAAGDITEDVMNALIKIENPTKRAALAQDILKGANQDMLAVLSQGSDVINEQRQAAHDLGVIQSGPALEGANKFRMGMENLKSQIGGIVGTLGAEFAPLLSDVVLPLIQDHIVPIIRKFAELVGGLSDKFNNLPGPIKGVIGGVLGMAVVLGPMLVVGGKVATLFAADGNLVKGFGHVKKGFTSLMNTLKANPWILLIVAVVALVIIIVKNWDTITAFLKKTWDWITKTAGKVWEFLKDIFKAGLKFLVDLFLNWTGPGLIIKNFDKIRDAALAVKDWIVDKFNAIVTFFTKMPGRIASATSGMWDGIKTAFRASINWLISKWNAFKLKLGGQTVSLPFGLGFTIPSITLVTPNIQKIHSGGVFRAPTVGGEGLAILRDRERVIPVGGSGAGAVDSVAGAVVQILPVFVGSTTQLAAEIDRMLTKRSRTSGLGF